jgi:3'-5' exoribonuclease-like protein
MNDVMVDLETWGTKAGCAIRSVGAVFFDPETGMLGDEFYATVTDASCKRYKLQKEQGTVDWWNQPENALANKQLSEGQLDLAEVLVRFEQFWNRGRGRWFWSQGANFDEPILGAAIDAVQAYHAKNPVEGQVTPRRPWKFFEAQDTRTIYRVSAINVRAIRRNGTYHNALDDAKHQVVCVSTGHKRLRGTLV